MAKRSKLELFWTSYSDLMTSVFFAMLVLFVVIVVAMGFANRNLAKALQEANMTIEDQNKLLKLTEQFEKLSESSSLGYDNDQRVFYAKDLVGIEIFYSNNDTIKKEYFETVDKVGEDISKIIAELNKNNNFKYQLVIEGTAAIPYAQLKSNSYNHDNREMYELSYRRALALYTRWQAKNFRPTNTEVIIAGSGYSGNNRDKKNENNNKRFTIQIIPKIDNPVSSKKK